jgi:hypothetical protein
MAGHLYDELDRMHCTDVVISTNKKPYSRSSAEALDDPGVAVYFKRKGQELAIACDKYLHVSDNLHAIGIAIECFRSLERHGTGEMVDAAFMGFKALPETIIMGEGTVKPWYEVLGVDPDAQMSTIDAAYKRKLHETHPDKGGSAEDFQKVQDAYTEARGRNNG